MGSLLLEAEITGRELVGQLKGGAGGRAKDKKQYEIQIEKSMILLKYIYVPEAENIRLEYYKSFTL